MACEPCAVCGRGCARHPTPEGLACRSCAEQYTAGTTEGEN